MDLKNGPGIRYKLAKLALEWVISNILWEVVTFVIMEIISRFF